MKVQVNALALEQAINAVGKFYGIEGLSQAVREVYDNIDALHAQRIQALLDEGKTLEDDRELFVEAVNLDATIVPPKGEVILSYEWDSGDETNIGH